MMRFNREAILTLDLHDGLAYADFLNGMLAGRFKFSLVENKFTTLADVLIRAQDFIQEIEICVRDDFVLARCLEKSRRR